MSGDVGRVPTWEFGELEPYVHALAVADRLLARRERQLAARVEFHACYDVRQVREELKELKTKLREGPCAVP